MTATPKETKYASNLTYFGEPLYTYSLNQGIQDGFLAPFRVIQVTTNIGEGWRPRKGQVDIYGHEIPDRYYTDQDYDYNVVLEDRIRQVAEDITDYLKRTDRMSKTIVFCAKEDHAERMRVALAKCNQDMIRKYPNYVVRITGSDEYGKSQLDYFKSVSAKTPVIATTSKLISTGVNCKTVKLIVLDQWITSMTEFKQIIGRGARLEPRAGKWDFTVMDFRNVSALFADPDWDGPVIVDPGFPGGPDPYGGGGGKGKSGVDEPPEIYNETPIVDANGCHVQILQRTVSIYDDEGKLLRQESITDYTKTNVRGKYATLRDFIQNWKDQDKKEAIRQEFRELGIDFEKMKTEQNMTDVDDYDFICYVAYGERPMTRKERAEAVKKENFFTRYSGAAKEVLEALLEKYKDSGIYDLEETSILKIAPFNQFGSPANIARLFGSGQGYKDAVKELETEIYKMG